MAGRIGIITGLAFEADLARKVSNNLNLDAEAPLVRCVGMGAGANLEQAIADLAAEGAKGVVSFGLAGGLDAELKAGTLALPKNVRDAAGTLWPVDAVWRSAVLSALGAAHPVTGRTVLASGAMLISVAAKEQAYRSTGACAADMESAKIAAAAQTAGLKLLVLRAVADDADMALPPAATAMSPEGTLRWGGVAGSLLRRPGQLPDLVRLGLKSRAACASLEDALKALLRAQR